MTAVRLTEAALARADWYEALHKLFETYDILALPTAQVFPFDATVHWPTTVGGREMDTYHRWMEVVIGGTLSGNPVVNVPVGFDEQGRPMGIQCIGRMGQDKVCSSSRWPTRPLPTILIKDRTWSKRRLDNEYRSINDFGQSLRRPGGAAS